MIAKICPVCKSEYRSGEVFCPNDGQRLVTASQLSASGEGPKDPLVGTVIDERYRVIRRIGEGGMGIVYEVEHVVIEKRFALKVLREDYCGNPEVVERFRREAKSASRIGNEHIVDISDFGELPSGSSYFVMEFLEGEDLANVLARERSLPLLRAADITIQCAKALGAAHAKGIIHRDMKPENIFLIRKDDRPDFVKIVDFGIAMMADIETPGSPHRKLTKAGMVFGTPEYISPEQAAGKPIDHRSDIYSLGVILFEMLTGRVPFTADSFVGVLTKHLLEPPPSLKSINPELNVPEAVEGVIEKALAKDPNARFQSCEEMAAALEEALKNDSKPQEGEDWRVERRTQIGYALGTRTPSSPPSPVERIAPAEFSSQPKASPWRSFLIIGGVTLLLVAAL
ncbi:MAG: protein kinase, partial [Deltaproteobacteria bacterium]|nr:protein kinase [Deltaproteobacteria bacterium]